ncbi:hypothetical protein A8C56_15475 [Niabella ginsenosidivorans]|uniref:Phosphodiester glycosidase domain-containing protein n=1 Tax=Niabella ginsenosidivorans TaxID=1176587 RepID=A0A1A9IBC6_9BACT|nr:hypothetical protein A8C56_15475 [Niabella ginsenosidivorans]
MAFFSPSAFSQDADSLRFVKPYWEKERVAKGVVLIKQQFFNKALFGANQYISYMIIKNKKRKNGFNIAAEAKQLKTTAAFAEAVNAGAAVNGNFFYIKEGGSEDYVKVNGTVISKNTVPGNGRMAFHQKAAVLVSRGQLSIQKGGADPDWPDTCNAASVLCSGPLLLMNGIKEMQADDAFSRNRHPRTAVGVTTKGSVILLVADGRNANAAGLNLEELAKIMRWLGCTSAINLDGGGSSTLWVKHKGVINHPSDNKKWDHEGQRNVANILYFKR